MKEIVFEPLKLSGPGRFAVASHGGPGTGKTRLGATMFGKIAVIPLERKTRFTIEKTARELGITNGKIVFPKADFIRHEQPLKVANLTGDALDRYYLEHRCRVVEAIYSAADNPSIDSVFIDSGTQLHEDICFARCGRAHKLDPKTQRAPINQDWKDILNTLQSKHLLISHHTKQVWRNDRPTNEWELSGYNSLGYSVNVIIEQEFDVRTGDFNAYVRQCQDRPDLVIDTEPLLTGALITFQQLAININPDGDWSDE